jgi:hypothetical protein
MFEEIQVFQAREGTLNNQSHSVWKVYDSQSEVCARCRLLIDGVDTSWRQLESLPTVDKLVATVMLSGPGDDAAGCSRTWAACVPRRQQRRSTCLTTKMSRLLLLEYWYLYVWREGWDEMVS